MLPIYTLLFGDCLWQKALKRTLNDEKIHLEDEILENAIFLMVDVWVYSGIKE